MEIYVDNDEFEKFVQDSKEIILETIFSTNATMYNHRRDIFDKMSIMINIDGVTRNISSELDILNKKILTSCFGGSYSGIWYSTSPLRRIANNIVLLPSSQREIDRLPKTKINEKTLSIEIL